MKAYQLKVTIMGSHPPIWRRVIVPAGLTFSQLTLIMNTIMEWCGYHLSNYAFDQLDTVLYDNYNEDVWDYRTTLDAALYKIDEFFDFGNKCIYTYDFGDDWRHKIDIEKILDDYPHNYAQVIKYKGNSPIEDSGGIYGYYDILERLNNPDSPDNEELRDWAESQGYSEFCVDYINETLEAMALSKKKHKPMTLSELYDREFKGNHTLFTITIPKDRDDEPIEEDDDYYYDDAADDEEGFPFADALAPQSIVEFTYGLTRTEMIIKLLKNTKMTEDQIFKALEMEKDEIEDHHHLVAMMKEAKNTREGKS